VLSQLSAPHPSRLAPPGLPRILSHLQSTHSAPAHRTPGTRLCGALIRSRGADGQCSACAQALTRAPACSRMPSPNANYIIRGESRPGTAQMTSPQPSRADSLTPIQQLQSRLPLHTAPLPSRYARARSICASRVMPRFCVHRLAGCPSCVLMLQIRSPVTDRELEGDLVRIQKSRQGVGAGAIFERPTPAEMLVASSKEASVSCCSASTVWMRSACV
jgi:hypothetical protein